MPTYVVLGKWTEQGIRNVKDTVTHRQWFRRFKDVGKNVLDKSISGS